MFFSTTDLLGVITGANPVFVRLSRFGYRELMNAPHNIIRHPVMPGGAFKLMWDTLKAGEPFCAYVDNLASGGSTYSVFATITPLGHDSYLSVRCRPQRTDLRGAAFSLYEAARAQELDARAAGMSDRQAAVIGLSNLAAGLKSAGFATYKDFMEVALPAEVEIRLSQPLETRPTAIGPASDMLVAANRLSGNLHDWSMHQTRLSDVAQRLKNAIPMLRASMDDALATAKSFVATDDGGFTPLMVWIELWAQMMGTMNAVLSELTGSLADLWDSCLRTSFRISLAVLHTQTVAQFAAELIDGVTVPDYDENARTTAVMALGQALVEGFDLARQQDAHNAEQAQAATNQLAFVRDLMGVPRELIVSWQAMAATQTNEVITRALPAMTEQMRNTDATLALLDQLRDSVSTVAMSAPSEQVNESLTRVLRTVDALARQSSRPPATP